MTKKEVQESIEDENLGKMPDFSRLSQQSFARFLKTISRDLSLKSDFIFNNIDECIEAVIYKSVPQDTFSGGVTTLQIPFDYAIPTEKMTDFDSFYTELEKLENDAQTLQKALILNF